MTREQKIKYLQLISSGVIVPVKQLPPGTYRPTNDAEPFYFGFWGITIRYWDNYTNGIINAPYGAFMGLKLNFTPKEVCVIPKDMQEQFTGADAEGGFNILCMDEIIVEPQTAAQIALRQLQQTEDDSEPIKTAGPYSHTEFMEIVRPQLLKALAEKNERGAFPHKCLTLNL